MAGKTKMGELASSLSSIYGVEVVLSTDQWRIHKEGQKKRKGMVRGFYLFTLSIAMIRDIVCLYTQDCQVPSHLPVLIGGALHIA